MSNKESLNNEIEQLLIKNQEMSRNHTIELLAVHAKLISKSAEAQEYRAMLERVMNHPDDCVIPAIKTIISFLLFQYPT